MTKGTKRASPGADEEKNLFGSVELSDEDAKRLDVVQKELQRAELVVEREVQTKLVPVYEKRREVVKTIPKFWPIALLNHNVFAIYAQHNADQVALSYLEDVWIVRDPREFRCYTIEFHFKENPYFHDQVLKKEYQYVAAHATEDDKPDEDGITQRMLEFSWERDIKPSTTKINWKDEDKALTKLYPRKESEVEDEEDEDIPADSGSFFNFFELESDPLEIGVSICNEIFPEAIDYFLGRAGGESLDSDEEDEDDDDDAEEIDLEKPKAKKQKV
ncbi:hypothetical protein E1B28_001379 [Marasmius oreades]|uniref:Protein SET n=1 Tax=Marasmius oreades TaxID=181124 RepID=A0A9P7V3B9_9AGAR|nr:uncharacterized protein E1B28_001379 [Marasmius oreades]KAG7099545.1 hypothetical protein E1B28_001379 [Marasmius oreades]